MTEQDDMIAALNAADKTRPDLPAGLMARVLADATAAQLALNPADNIVPLARSRPVLGWVASGALAASALFGLALGYGGADLLTGVSSLADMVAGSSSNLSSGVDALGAMNAFLAEG